MKRSSSTRVYVYQPGGSVVCARCPKSRLAWRTSLGLAHLLTQHARVVLRHVKINLQEQKHSNLQGIVALNGLWMPLCIVFSVTLFAGCPTPTARLERVLSDLAIFCSRGVSQHEGCSDVIGGVACGCSSWAYFAYTAEPEHKPHQGGFSWKVR